MNGFFLSQRNHLTMRNEFTQKVIKKKFSIILFLTNQNKRAFETPRKTKTFSTLKPISVINKRTHSMTNTNHFDALKKLIQKLNQVNAIHFEIYEWVKIIELIDITQKRDLQERFV